MKVLKLGRVGILETSDNQFYDWGALPLKRSYILPKEVYLQLMPLLCNTDLKIVIHSFVDTKKAASAFANTSPNSSLKLL